jgi:hypothetical protein
MLHPQTPGPPMHRAARLLHSQSHVLEERGDVGISVHCQALSKPHHVLRRVQVLLHG